MPPYSTARRTWPGPGAVGSFSTRRRSPGAWISRERMVSPFDADARDGARRGRPGVTGSEGEGRVTRRVRSGRARRGSLGGGGAVHGLDGAHVLRHGGARRLLVAGEDRLDDADVLGVLGADE